MSAYTAGLRMLSGRELTESQLRLRLARRRFEPHEIDEAVGRLREHGALDDRRAAFVCARAEAHVKHHGRRRALRRLEAAGVPRPLAAAVVNEVFGELDEDALISQALDRRLSRGASLHEAAVVRRLHRYLLAQGFDTGRVNAVLRTRVRDSRHDD